MRRFAATSALALLLLAVLPGSSGHTAVPYLGAIESDRCVGVAFIAFLPYQAVQPHLPSGYIGYYIPLVAQTHLIVYDCEEVTVGSVTESNVTVAVAGTATLEGIYRWETFVDEPSPNAVQGLLEDAGWPVIEGTFTWTATGVVVEGDGIAYTLTTSPQRLGHPTWTDVSVIPQFHETPGGDHLQQDEAFSTGTQGSYPSVLQAEGGVWQAITGGIAGVPVPGLVADVDTLWRSDVHEAE